MSETNTVSPLRQRMIEDMAARKLNPHTQRSHIYSCKRFAAWLKRSPDTATPDEVLRFQLYLIESGASKHRILDVKQRYGYGTLLIEESPISLGLIQSIRENSVSVTPYRPDRDKRARLIAQSDFFAAESIRLPERAAWLEEFVAELLAFPGRHDDQVDALTQGLAWGREQGRLRIYSAKHTAAY